MLGIASQAYKCGVAVAWLHEATRPSDTDGSAEISSSVLQVKEGHPCGQQ